MLLPLQQPMRCGIPALQKHALVSCTWHSLVPCLLVALCKAAAMVAGAMLCVCARFLCLTLDLVLCVSGRWQAALARQDFWWDECMAVCKEGGCRRRTGS
jgi:hypothetical protein